MHFVLVCINLKLSFQRKYDGCASWYGITCTVVIAMQIFIQCTCLAYFIRLLFCFTVIYMLRANWQTNQFVELALSVNKDKYNTTI